MSTRILPAQVPVPSWFRRMLVLDYYDGPKEAIAECVEGHLALLRLVDWDELQDVRIFSVVEEETERFDRLAALLGETENPRWPVYVPRLGVGSSAQKHISHLLTKMRREPEYLVASEDATRTIVASKPWPKGVDERQHDWFGELEIERKRERDASD